MKIQLCKCSKCGSILIDENPPINAPLYDLIEYPHALEMHKLCDIPGDVETLFWACPFCLTDDYLIDL